MSERRVAVAAALDAASIVLFVAIGRRNHDEDAGLSGLVSTAAPFLIALVVGWVLARAWRRPLDVVTGVIVWITTVALGMVLRNLVFDRGTAASFVVVASVFTALTLVGWRALAGVLGRRLTPGW